jgi:hypothetical protein
MRVGEGEHRDKKFNSSHGPRVPLPLTACRQGGEKISGIGSRQSRGTFGPLRATSSGTRPVWGGGQVCLCDDRRQPPVSVLQICQKPILSVHRRLK